MKLTNHHRDAIANAAAAYAFDPKAAALSKTEDMLAREAYELLFPLSQRVAVKALPKFWFNHVNSLIFNVNGAKITLKFLGDAVPAPAVSKLGSGNPANGYSPVGAVPAGDLAERIMKHVDARDSLAKERKAARTDLRAMLGTITTDKQLREAWPEGEEFYSKFSAAPVSLPAVSMADINKRFGLPPETVA